MALTKTEEFAKKIIQLAAEENLSVRYLNRRIVRYSLCHICRTVSDFCNNHFVVTVKRFGADVLHF